MRTNFHLVTFLILLAILLFFWSILRPVLLSLWLHQRRQENKPKSPRPLKPKTGDDCRLCQAAKPSAPKSSEARPTLRSWNKVRAPRSRK